MNVFPSAEVSDKDILAKTCQYSMGLVFRGELAPGDASKILGELPGFFTSCPSIPEVIFLLLNQTGDSGKNSML